MIYSADQILDEFSNYLSSRTFGHAPEGLYKPIDYVLAAGGKRIRPTLLLMAYNLYGDKIHRVMPLATGIEIYHNYTLLHDDIMDNADMRRGRKTVHKLWDENTAILSGDAMLVLAYQYMALASEAHLKEVLDLFSTTAIQICEGQQFDVDFEKKDTVTEEEYITMIRLKTAVLLASALKIGAIEGGATKADADLLYEFGINIGLAFQLKDDLLDAFGDAATFGKNIGGDIVSNKKTFLMISALGMADEPQKTELLYWLSLGEFDPREKIATVISIYEQIGVKIVCENAIDYYFSKAITSLENVSVKENKKSGLFKLVGELMLRDK